MADRPLFRVASAPAMSPICVLMRPCCLPPTDAPCQMYKFGGKLAPGGDYREQLRSFAREGYAATEPLDVPPEPSPFDWLVRGAQAKLAALQTAVAAGDVRQLAAVLLPLLLVCLFALVLMLASLASKKTKKD